MCLKLFEKLYEHSNSDYRMGYEEIELESDLPNLIIFYYIFIIFILRVL